MNLDSDTPGSKTTGRRYSAAEWDSVRAAFASSIMVETSLNSLAQNLDLPEWPADGASETPSRYINLGYEELAAMPAFEDHPERIDLLIDILKETSAFDDPFGAMVTEQNPEKDNPILKNLAKLGIPEDFPMPLVALTAETRAYCMEQNLTTLKEFALFAQSVAQSVVVAGDFRALLNALSHIDETTLSMYLPYRPGEKGLHLIEGLALTVRAYAPEVQARLAQNFGARLGSEDAARAIAAGADETATAFAVLTQHTAAYVDYFETDLGKLQVQINEGVALGRLAGVLNDAVVETVVTSLLKPYLTLPNARSTTRTTNPPMEEVGPKRSGIFSSLKRFFSK